MLDAVAWADAEHAGPRADRPHRGAVRRERAEVDLPARRAAGRQRRGVHRAARPARSSGCSAPRPRGHDPEPRRRGLRLVPRRASPARWAGSAPARPAARRTTCTRATCGRRGRRRDRRPAARRRRRSGWSTQLASDVGNNCRGIARNGPGRRPEAVAQRSWVPACTCAVSARHTKNRRQSCVRVQQGCRSDVGGRTGPRARAADSEADNSGRSKSGLQHELEQDRRRRSQGRPAYDVGGRGDQSFNDSAAAGLDKADEELGAHLQGGRGRGRRDETAREERLRAAEAGYNPIIAVGFAYADVGRTRSPRTYPDINFAVDRRLRADAKAAQRTSPTWSSPRTRAPSSSASAAALKTKTGTSASSAASTST